MDNSINSAMAAISTSYVDSLKKMSTSLTRLGTLKRFQTASEDLGAYLKLKSIQSSKDILETASNSITEGQAFLSIADAYSTSLLNDLEDLKTAAFNRENGGTPAAIAAATAEFDSLRLSIEETLSTEYNGVGLNVGANTTFETVRMANGGSLALAFDTTQDEVTYVNTAWAGNYADTADDIDDEIVFVNSFIAKVAGYSAQLDSQESFVSTMITNYEAAESNITEINIASETVKYTTYNIRQQAATSMISQANISRKAILNLFNFS